MRSRVLVEKVQKMYKDGLGVCEIAKLLKQDSTNVSRWCRKNTTFTTLENPTNKVELERKYWYTHDKVNSDISNLNNAKILLASLYWCEGCKYPMTNRIEFVSSDENMQLTFISTMRKVFKEDLLESKFRVMLQLHTTHDLDKTISYWSNLLQIPPNQFTKPHITIGKQTRYRPTYNGTCSLRYQDYRLLLRLMGIYSQIGEQARVN